jgi:hypothetical protein
VRHREIRLTLRLTSAGRLQPWLGPALRGLVARSLKERVCRFPPAIRDRDWVHCRGCPHLTDCPYGSSYEPDPPTDAGPGRDDAIRPVVLAPLALFPEDARAGLVAPVRLLAVGPAVPHLGLVADALTRAGRAGVGPDRVRFDPGGTDTWQSTEGDLSPADLPSHPDATPGVVPRVGVGLLSPLFLNHPHERRPVERPTLADLLRACFRCVAELMRVHGEPVPADFPALRAAAERGTLADHCYEPFAQRRWSNRTEQRYEMHGVVGGGVYRDVPAALLPWLLWGGRWHAGTHRVAGAGGWRLVLD